MSAPLCVGHMLSCRMFSLFNGLPSPLSVTSLSSLFEWFISTMPLSDSSATRGEPCGLGLLSPSYRPFGSADVAEVSRFSCMKFPDVLWVLRLRGTAQGLALAPLLMLPSTISTVSASRLLVFEAQSPSPPVPLFTLHRLPRGRRCKTQGRVGRYSFLVRLFHSLLHAGLSRRSEIPRMRPLPCRYDVFSPSCSCYPLPDARRISRGPRTAPVLRGLGWEYKFWALHSLQPHRHALHGYHRFFHASY